MSELLVCSVFSGSEFDGLWLSLQRDFLRRTAGKFDHAVHLSHRADPSLFKGSAIVGISSPEDRGGNEHLKALRALSAYCRNKSYSGYLILDCDAFPIAPGWEETLQYYLRRFNKRCAAPVRTENLDGFAHPCAVYTQDPYALHWGQKAGVNLLGQPVTDVTCLESEFFPLVRTNRRVLHPTLATVYMDLFYHHGCGSRAFSMRTITVGYYDQILMSNCCDSEELRNQLQADPQGFIKSLC